MPSNKTVGKVCAGLLKVFSLLQNERWNNTKDAASSMAMKWKWLFVSVVNARD